ncbi:alpha/beta hydrolase family protein [Bailinhaonella thermotolerans]|uniref:Alpha/beta hydrolase n=1 Tax=Bailinhaonella thermotolerans TaxID=1070861 RepID=A0A3A4APT3_9ACTN|nr:alpha/beta fold hydrolase [Bailinhaonella thermotolerans]RJL31686.1 alpha/beta hydrolase [Bailinhaonella thermotolerans]
MVPGRHRLGLITGAVLIGLAITGGTLSPPAFDPPPLRAEPRYSSLPPIPPAEQVRPAPLAPVRQIDLRIPVKGTVLESTIYYPASPGRHPAMVFVHGSGSAKRSEFVGQARRLAAAGIVTMSFDKRGVGYSFRHRDFRLLADDALAALRVLRARPDVDPSRVGLWGVSEGSWVAPIAAAQSTEVAFLILVSAPNVSPLRQVAWAMNEQLRRLHAPDGARQMLGRAMGLAEFDFLRYDPIPVLERIRQPVLAIYGTADPAIPFIESARALSDALDRAGNTSYSIRFIPNANHGMRIPGSGFVPGYLESMANWMRGLPATAAPEPRVAGGTPVQRYAAIDVPQTPWYGGSSMAFAAVILACAGYLAWPTAALVSRLRTRDGRGRSGDGGLPWATLNRRLLRLALSGVAFIVAFLGFIATVVLFSIHQAGSFVGLHLGWITLRGTTLLMLVLQVTTVAAVIEGLREGWRLSRRQYLAVLGPVGGTGLLMLAASYYGLYAYPW